MSANLVNTLRLSFKKRAEKMQQQNLFMSITATVLFNFSNFMEIPRSSILGLNVKRFQQADKQLDNKRDRQIDYVLRKTYCSSQGQAN